jgi:dipeptidyl aminopeptidase/acylaminoacyl peptidase
MHKFLLFSFTAFYFCTASAQVRRPLLPSDVYRMPTLSDPQVSPDGKWVAYQLSVVDTAKDSRVSHLWMQSWDGTASVQLTFGSEPASTPRWSPDGKYLAFLSSREPKNASQVWLMDRRGGEGKQLTDVKGDLQDYRWSPDAKRLLLVIQDPENKGKEAPKTPLPIRIDRYHFKQDVNGYLQHLHTHLYVFDIATKKLDTLTTGNTDEAEPSWSPDGKSIAFVSNHSPDVDRNENADVFTIEARPNATPIQLTTWKGKDHDPQWSPDGKNIAYLRSTTDAAFIMYDEDMLCVASADGRQNKAITATLDRPVTAVRWSNDGNSLNFLVEDNRTHYLAKYDVAAGALSVLAKGKFAITGLENHPSGAWLLEKTSPELPGELFAFENGNLRRLTFHQDEWLKGIDLAEVQGFTSTSSDGAKVSGILYTNDTLQHKKLPFVLFIHGGPVGQDDYSFDFTRQVLASGGYAVAAVNYRGSNGRGIKYTASIYADWGHKEVKDLLGAVDELVKRGIADPGRLGIGGWSYGGILTDYTIATDTRFKAACSGAGSALQTTMYGIDQYVLQYDNELGPPWKNPKKWISLSYPFFHADKIKTPVLFMSGLKDFNVPTAGSEQMYQALKSQGIQTELILYPNQYHGISTPSYQADRLRRYLDWYAKYLR